ncbi:alpha/beta hydrolase [Kineococcus sp. NUM-3379]
MSGDGWAYRNPYEHLAGTGALMSRRVRSAGFTERTFDAGGTRTNYVVGPGNGPPLVLLPAQMGTWETYEPVLALLSRSFQVFAPDLRGHGRSTWTPGDYSWSSFGADTAAFLEQVVGRPAIVSGNSSGGLVALWCAANVPGRVRALVLEDAPVFSAEMPRFRDRDRYVYRGLEHAVAALGDLEHRDLTDHLRGQELPVSETRSRRVPGWFLDLVSRRLQASPDGLLHERWLPSTVRRLFASLAMFDPDVARAFVDGRVQEGLDHAGALRRVRCPVLLVHADWHRYAAHGLVGAMDDDDAGHLRRLVPHTRYRRVRANHVVHRYRPRWFVREVTRFARDLPAPG